MPSCPRCGDEFEADALCHHERDGIVRVHCPDCGQAMGSYNRHGARRSDR